MKRNAKNKKKILLMGLDAAGKSSILLSLKNDTRLSSYCKLGPTLEVSRAIIDDDENEFFIFDFGGQKKLIDGYLQRLDEYLAEVDKIIFVIDINDVDRHQLAMDYLKQILDHLDAENMNVTISIFFHKYDKSLPVQQLTNLDATAQELVENISRIVPTGIHVEFFKTSIFTVFQKTIMK